LTKYREKREILCSNQKYFSRFSSYLSFLLILRCIKLCFRKKSDDASENSFKVVEYNSSNMMTAYSCWMMMMLHVSDFNILKFSSSFFASFYNLNTLQKLLIHDILANIFQHKKVINSPYFLIKFNSQDENEKSLI
jgi:hypothetical protein